jgi:hypothetical protein
LPTLRNRSHQRLREYCVTPSRITPRSTTSSACAVSRSHTLLAAAKRHDDGRISYRPDLLATLQRQELDRIGGYLATKRNDGSIYVPAGDGAPIRGTWACHKS